MGEKVVSIKREPEIKLTFVNDNYYEMRRKAADRARRKLQRKINTLRGIGGTLIAAGLFLGCASINDPTHWYMGCIAALPLIAIGVKVILKTEK